MKLACDLLNILKRSFDGLIPTHTLSGRLVQDSRQVQAGDLFIAFKGVAANGADFIPAALNAGAALVLVESNRDHLTWQQGVAVIELIDLRERLGVWLTDIAGMRCGAPHLIGVTGTNGKTSVTHYVAQLLRSCHQRAGVIGTVGNGVLGALSSASHTTPDRIGLHQLLITLWPDQVDYLAMEVSSHALDQQRTAGLPFDIAVFTNLSRDHLDYHISMADYEAAKHRLFLDYPLRYAVVNLDDASGVRLAEALAMRAESPKLLTVSVQDQRADLYCAAVSAVDSGFQLRLAGRWGEYDLLLPLLGRFNIANALASAAVLLAYGFPMQQVADALEQLTPVRGRMQTLPEKAVAEGSEMPVSDIQIVVDYAHTPDALQQALQAVRQHFSGQLWCVLGCGGDRDAGKRPLMATIACHLADHVVLTSDNPRSEPPEQILDQMQHGLTRPAAAVLSDRRHAIHYAVMQAKPGDLVLIAGKGHETYQEVQGVRHFFDDAQEALSTLQHRPFAE